MFYVLLCFTSTKKKKNELPSDNKFIMHLLFLRQGTRSFPFGISGEPFQRAGLRSLVLAVRQLGSHSGYQ